jgi:hypothetical protein
MGFFRGDVFVAWTSYCCYLKREEEKCRARRRKHLKVVGLWTGRGESSLVQLAFHYTVYRRIWNSAPLAIYFRFRKKQKKVVFDGNERRKWGNVVGAQKKNKHTKEFGQSKLDLGVIQSTFFRPASSSSHFWFLGKIKKNKQKESKFVSLSKLSACKHVIQHTNQTQSQNLMAHHFLDSVRWRQTFPKLEI